MNRALARVKSFFRKEKRLSKRTTKLPICFRSYALVFITFIVVPIVLAMLLAATSFDMVNFPSFVGFSNFVYLFTADSEFMRSILPNTLKYAILIGPGGYVLSFLMAWCLAQLPHRLRTVLAVILYTPSLTAGITMAVVWKVVFAGDEAGYLNHLLLEMGLIAEPIAFLQSPKYLFPIMVIVTLWGAWAWAFWRCSHFERSERIV